MAIIGKEKYTQEKIDKLLDYLKMYHDMGQPIDYEIVIDGFKAVRRTDNPDLFSLFENFVNADTRSVEILFYQGTSNNNDKHIFTMQEEPKEAGLSGIDIDNKIQDHVSKAKKEWEFEQLKKDSEEWKAYAEELEEDISKLEKELLEVKSAQSPLHGFLGQFGSSLVSGIVKQNPQIADKIPGLSGLLEPTEKPKSSEPAPGSDISFTSAEPAADQEAEEARTFVKHIRSHFQGDKFDKLMQIIDLLAISPYKLEEVINLLNN